MKRPIRIYLMDFNELLITDKKLNEPYIGSYENVPNAERKAEQLRDNEVESYFPKLDIDLASDSMYALSEDDIDIYCHTWE